MKYAANDNAKNPLAGAVFQLKDANGTIIKLVQLSDTACRVANAEGTKTVTSFTTMSGTKIKLTGILRSITFL